ncbi:MAG: NUDIX hydrolase [Candidatus Competibacteraceae bacterium]
MPQMLTSTIVRPRAAASLVVLRRETGEPEFLLGRRPATMTFMPNAYVFPGGRLEPDDSRIQAATPLDPTIAPYLAVGNDARRAQALAAAAIRETFEETGLLLGRPGDVGAVAGPSWLAFKQTGLAPDLARLRYIARAITPTFRPLRFHARFFLAELTGSSEPLRENNELLDLRWLTLSQSEALPLAEVTRFVLAEALRLLNDTTEGSRRAVFTYHRIHGRRVRYCRGGFVEE